MSKRLLFIPFLVIFAFFVANEYVSGQDDNPVIHVITVEGVISPVSADYIAHEIEAAEEADAEALIVELDTPGGLMNAMRDIIKLELNADVPVVMYVSPMGAQCASAGVFISYAAHIFAMAPGTNVGSASPVTMGGGGGMPGTEQQSDTTEGSSNQETMMRKVMNDAVAQIKTLAEERGRNAEWAEKAVREAVNITENEALELNVIDYISPSVDSLISQIDGDTVKLRSGEIVLSTKNAVVVQRERGLRYKVLEAISHPNVAYILMVLGFYGLFFELSNPGAIFPGVIGAFSLILAFFAFQVLPINYAGVALIILAIILFIIETQVPSFGLLTAGGIIAMTIGSFMLIDSPLPEYRVTWTVIIPVVLTTAAFFVLAMGLVFRAMKNKPTTGSEGIIGEIGEAETTIHTTGTVSVHGETWSAYSNERIPAGSKIKVIDRDGLKLQVERARKS